MEKDLISTFSQHFLIQNAARSFAEVCDIGKNQIPTDKFYNSLVTQTSLYGTIKKSNLQLYCSGRVFKILRTKHQALAIKVKTKMCPSSYGGSLSKQRKLTDFLSYQNYEYVLSLCFYGKIRKPIVKFYYLSFYSTGEIK